MDYGYKFEKLINRYIGTPDYVTYANNWNDKNERTALLFTACIKEYDKNSTGDIGEKLQYFMEELFKDDNEERKISKECMEFLNGLK
tara:strand:- start:60 stop:320 length:261 start_codon:yes stop_codon:yes gene_type:complete